MRNWMVAGVAPVYDLIFVVAIIVATFLVVVFGGGRR
jgi:hypothetical protein